MMKKLFITSVSFALLSTTSMAQILQKKMNTTTVTAKPITQPAANKQPVVAKVISQELNIQAEKPSNLRTAVVNIVVGDDGKETDTHSSLRIVFCRGVGYYIKRGDDEYAANASETLPMAIGAFGSDHWIISSGIR